MTQSFKTSSSIFKILFLFSLFFQNLKIVPDQEQNNKKFNLKSSYFTVSSEILTSVLKDHPILCSTLLSSSIWYYLYPDHVAYIKNMINENRDIVLATTLSTLALACYKKNSILNYLAPQDQEDDEDETELVADESQYSQFAKSHVKIYGPSQIKTTFDDVAGLEAAKEDLLDIVYFLKNPEKFLAIGAHAPKGILLSGSPGNGKTLLARALAGEVQCPFLYISASQIMEAICGIGAVRIRHLFSIAKELAPCIIFIDEIDTIGSKRTMSVLGGDSEKTQTLNQLLSEMDGFEEQEYPIIVIGATNRAAVLDEALLRPGRFDRSVEINSPYIKDRAKILEIHFKNVQTADDINIEKIACATTGFSGAELANLVNEAALLAIRANKDKVTMAEVDQAWEFMLLGRETKGMQATQDDFWKTAVHESGHALARVFQTHATPLYKVTITPRGDALGLTYGVDDREYYSYEEEELRAEIVVCLAGSVAEELILQRRGIGASADLIQARNLATIMVMHCGMTEEFKDVTFAEFAHNQVHLPDTIATKLHTEIAKIINECRTVAIQILTEHKTELLALSDMLMEQKTISGEDVYKLCNVEVPAIQFSLNS